MKISCPKCGQGFNVEDNLAGKSVACSKCGDVFIAQAQRKCPMCGEPIAEEAAICIACGTHLLTGRKLATRSEADLPERPVEEEEEPEPTLADRICMGIALFAPGLFKPSILLVAAGLVVVGFAIIGLSAPLLKMAPFAGVMIAASGIVLYAQAVAMVLSAEFSMLPNAMLEFDTYRWGVFIVLIPIPLVIMFALLKHFSTM